MTNWKTLRITSAAKELKRRIDREAKARAVFLIRRKLRTVDPDGARFDNLESDHPDSYMGTYLPDVPVDVLVGDIKTMIKEGVEF